VIGDAKPYNTALIVLDADFAPAWAKQNGVESAELDDLARDEKVRAAVQEGVDAANQSLARVEQIKKFHLVEGDWLPGGDELTPTMKLKRKPIAVEVRRPDRRALQRIARGRMGEPPPWRRPEVDRSNPLLDALFTAAPVGLASWTASCATSASTRRSRPSTACPPRTTSGAPSRRFSRARRRRRGLLRRVIETGEPVIELEISGGTPAQPGVERTWLPPTSPSRRERRV